MFPISKMVTRSWWKMQTDGKDDGYDYAPAGYTEGDGDDEDDDGDYDHGDDGYDNASEGDGDDDDGDYDYGDDGYDYASEGDGDYDYALAASMDTVDETVGTTTMVMMMEDMTMPQLHERKIDSSVKP